MKLIRESTMDFYHLVKDETETLCGRSRPKLTEIPGLISSLEADSSEIESVR